MYWRDIPKGVKIIETEHSYHTENGECIDWHGQEAAEAQRYLSHISIVRKNNVPKIDLTMEAKEVLQQCTVDGNVVKLPDIQLDRKDYLEVKKALELIGGKWKGGKVAGFVFQTDPTELLAKVADGESINLKKDYQFFATPDELCDTMVELAELDNSHQILEPSAGQGAIIKAIVKELGVKNVFCYEKMPVNLEILKGMTDMCTVMGEDFLESTLWNTYDRIIANPPFTKNQDIDHIKHMYEICKSGGKIVTLSSPHWQMASTKKCIEFREWLDEVNAEVMNIERDTFKSSGTSIETRLIIIDKE